jgi:thymidylate kinase
VSGSHGVGKTTVTALVHQILADHGVATSTFHHRADKASAASTPQSDRTGPPGWKRRLWRVLPVSLRAWLVAANDELRYSRSVARRITSAASQGQAAIIDRYVYDRLVDLRLHNRPRQQVWAVEVACRLMRKPDMTFFLIDSPERIHTRKDELSVRQITEYQSALKSLFMRLRISHLEVEMLRQSRSPSRPSSSMRTRPIQGSRMPRGDPHEPSDAIFNAETMRALRCGS